MPDYNTNYNWSMTSAGNVVLGVRADGTTGLADVTDTYFGDAEGKVTHTYKDDKGVDIPNVDSPEDYYKWLHGTLVNDPGASRYDATENNIFSAIGDGTPYNAGTFGQTR